MSSIVTWGDHRDNVTPDALEGPARMERLAAQAADDLADAPAQEVIGWAVETFGDRIAVIDHDGLHDRNGRGSRAAVESRWLKQNR